MARARKGGGGGGKSDPATEAFEAGHRLVAGHPMLGTLLRNARVSREKRTIVPEGSWAIVVDDGTIHVHPTLKGAPEEWAYVIAHALAHLAFGHFHPRPTPHAWNAACCVTVARFLAGMKFGRPPESMAFDVADLPSGHEESLYRGFVERGVPERFSELGIGGRVDDLWFQDRTSHVRSPRAWDEVFAEAIQRSVDSAIRAASGVQGAARDTKGQQARKWFIDRYPLLGALAASFEIVEDDLALTRAGVAFGAVSVLEKRVYLASSKMSLEECRFVMAHELLHVGLLHASRGAGRDAYLWNVACDFVINAWLVEMKIGNMPALGGLYDPELKDLGAEAVYDRIVTDLRRYRKLGTFRGPELGDIMGPREWWNTRDGLTIDDFCRRALAQGLEYHKARGRGLLPAGLEEAIRALDHPAIPWDVELARWLDPHFPRIETRRSYAQPSRRQSSTPDIPRARVVPHNLKPFDRTFGVVLDTSGSMESVDIGLALGAIASYALSREVPYVRLIFCDAKAHDAGYLAPEDLAGRVTIRGRGGTLLQPGIDLLETAEDFPKSGPMLIITDGACDNLSPRRDHAYLMPGGTHLPFHAQGPVFLLST